MNACELKRFQPVIFSILPDHLHLIVQSRARGLGYQHWNPAISPPYPQRGFKPALGKEEATISDLLHQIKGNISRNINRGTFWQRGFHSRIIDTGERFANTFKYVRWNYLKHKLPERFGQYPYLFVDEEYRS